MTRTVMLLMLAGLLFVPVAHAAEGGKVLCGAQHFVRLPLPLPTEIGVTSIGFRNTDLEHPVTIDRITIRGFSGGVLHDSGPAASVDHPPNTDISPAQDITVVPPGANFYLATNHIWGNAAIPAGLGGNQQGFSMSVVVQFSTPGKRDSFRVGSALRVRQLVDGIQGSDLSRRSFTCFEPK